MNEQLNTKASMKAKDVVSMVFAKAGGTVLGHGLIWMWHHVQSTEVVTKILDWFN